MAEVSSWEVIEASPTESDRLHLRNGTTVRDLRSQRFQHHALLAASFPLLSPHHKIDTLGLTSDSRSFGSKCTESCWPLLMFK